MADLTISLTQQGQAFSVDNHGAILLVTDGSRNWSLNPGDTLNVNGSMPMINKLFDGFFEMRFVVTPDLDGKQLQFRHKRTHIQPPEWTEWQPVPTIFMTKKLEIEDPKDASKK